MNFHHICIGDDPWCDWSGCQAGQNIMSKAGERFLCQHVTKASANRAAKGLRPFFKHGRVRVIPGPCPHA